MEDFDISSIKLIYYKYKDTPYYNLVVSIFLIFIGLFLIIFFIYPQASDAFSIQRETNNVRGSIDAIKENEQFIKNIPQNEIDSNYALTSSALPSNKNFVLIYEAIVDTAARSSVSLRDFSFSIGEVDKPDLEGGGTSLALTLSLDANSNGASRFIKNLYEAVPIAEVTKWDTTGENTIVEVVFYYDPKTNEIFEPTDRLVDLSGSENDVLNEIRSYITSKGSSGQVRSEGGSQSASFNLSPL